MRILDRYILKSFLVNYLLALGVMVGMYVLLDLIVNVQDFARGASPGSGAASAGGGSAWEVASDMFDYYFYQVPVIFQQVSGIIPTLAAGFTMVRMTRHHELTAMLSSGVSLYRVAAPIILVSMAMAAINVVNQEFIISQPFIIEKLLRKHDEVKQTTVRNEALFFIKDSDSTDSGGSLLSAREYEPLRKVNVSAAAPNIFTRASGSFTADGLRVGSLVVAEKFSNAANNGIFEVETVSPTAITIKNKGLVPEAATADSMLAIGGTMKDVFIVYRDASGRPINHKLAPFAHWEVPAGKTTEAWVMSGADRNVRSVIEEDDTGGMDPAKRVAFPAKIEVLNTRLTPQQIDLILSKKAVDYLSSARVHELAEFSPEVNRPLLYKIMHLRFTQPLMNIVMLLIGIPFLLTREPNRLIINMFYCTAVSGVVFIATFVIFQMGGTQLDPLLAAWLPVLVFGPFALVMMDMIQT